jgi:hypothetical protein
MPWTPTIIINQHKCHGTAVRGITVVHLFSGRQGITVGVLVTQGRRLPLVIIVIVATVHDHIATSYDVTHGDLIT